MTDPRWELPPDRDLRALVEDFLVAGLGVLVGLVLTGVLLLALLALVVG